MTKTLTIRVSKYNKNLVLIRSDEGVYFIFKDGRQFFNDLDYDIVSDNFNDVENTYRNFSD